MPNQVKFHRVLKANPAKVYKAFLDAAAIAQWLPPYGFTCTVHTLDAKVGGEHRMSFTNFSTGNGHSFGGKYLELVPGKKIKYTDAFDGVPSAMTTTVELKEVSCGTEINIVQEGIPDFIPPEQCTLGWQESLMKLAKLVDVEIPD